MISIAMASYNGEKFIKKQIESILSQTIQNFELIISDDCSIDNTIEIIKQFEKNDSRIHFFSKKENSGLIKNFENAIKHCKGDYIALCDQDDIWKNTHLETLINNIGNKDLVCGNEFLFEKEDNISLGIGKNKFIERGHFIPSNTDDMLLYLFCKGNFFTGNSMLIRSSFFSNVDVFPIPKTYYNHDAWFLILSILVGNGCIYTTDIVTYRRVHNDNATGIKMNLSLLEKIQNKLGYDKKSSKQAKIRLSLIKECLRRYKLDNRKQEILKQCEAFLIGKSSLPLSYKRFISVKFYVKHFNEINLCKSENSYKNKIARIIKYIFF